MFYRKAIENLLNWKKSSSRKPLVIRGARQVGKTTLVNEFSKNYEQYLYVNLEKSENKNLFIEYTDIQEIAQQLFFKHNLQWSKRENTLLFIDEIQEVPTAINFLRYFKEDLPELHVIAAGSMLETLLGKNISFPVGRVSYLVLRPVSFEEFLIAIDENMAYEQLHYVPLNSFAHSKLLKLFNTYAIIGGMPEIVEEYAKNRDYTSLKFKYDELLNSYHEDAEKYAKSAEQLQLIRFLLDQLLFESGKRITFQGFGKSNYKSKDVGEVLRTLQKTHLVHLLYPCTGFGIPVEQDFRKSPRLQFLDTGLMNYKVGLQLEIMGTKDLCSVYQGKMIEHLVGQEILSTLNLPLDRIHFWVRDKNSSSAELDFVYPCEGKLVPIEVKSGPKGKIKSLSLFMEQSNLNFAIRFYAGELKLDTVQTPKGKEFYLLNLPYFLASKTEQYITWLLENIPKEGVNFAKEPPLTYEKTKKQEQLATSLKELTDQHFKVLNFCKKEAKSSKEILVNCLGLSFQSRNKRLFIKPLLDLDLVEWTDKDYPKSRNQKYFLTKKGRKHA
jgi:hypothetical protein